MKISKKYKFYLISLCLVFSISSIIMGCNKTPLGDDITVNGGEETMGNINGNDDTPEFKMDEKKDVLLLFLIDEGIGEVELTTRYRNDKEAYEEALTKVYKGLKPLAQGYDVGVLIYPHNHYKYEGYGNMPGEPLDRVSPELLYAFDFFKSKRDMKVYLEIYSSGIYPNQDGKWATLEPAPLYINEPKEKGISGLPMDMDTLAALKQAYPDTFAGVRFHELLGVDELGVQQNNPHHVVLPEVIKAIVDTCKNNDLKLVWSDHGWYAVDYATRKKEMWNDLIDYATETLQKNVTFLWANNNFGIELSLGQTMGHRNIKEIDESSWGISVQSWAWVIYVASNWKWWQDNYKFYHFIEDGMPVELIIRLFDVSGSGDEGYIEFPVEIVNAWYIDFKGGIIDHAEVEGNKINYKIGPKKIVTIAFVSK